jgi:arabinan endo-1,5-alpha-L-arabinosidase
MTPPGMTRRHWLQSSLVFGVGPLLPPLWITLQPNPAQSLALQGEIRHIHDPAIIKTDHGYTLFSTGPGIRIRTSSDLLQWEKPSPSKVFSQTPAWVREAIPNQNDMWAPDISFFNDRYHLYYAVSTFGSNRSIIGLATNVTLDSDDPAYGWVDQGLVLESTGASLYNCIDANVILDADGLPWLAFGSFWTGIKLRRLDMATGKPSGDDTTLYALAQRTENSGAIEAPFIIRRGDFYYLFVSFDSCCQGRESTYHVRVGRSSDLTGPYVDRDGVPMLQGGGTQITFPSQRWRGPGHNAIIQDGETDYIAYHAYDAQNNGIPTLQIDPLVWDTEAWPSIASAI